MGPSVWNRFNWLDEKYYPHDKNVCQTPMSNFFQY